MRNTRKAMLKTLLDAVMLLLLSLMYQKRAISMRFHEVGGLVLFGLFLLHNGLNWKWIEAVSLKIFRAGLQPHARVSWLVNTLLLIAMTATVGTGLLISKTLPTSIQDAYLVKPWHYFSAAAALILTGIHLGLHWKYLHHILLSKLHLPQRVGKVLGSIFVVLVLAFGAYSLTASHFSMWLSGPFHTSTAFSEIHQQSPTEHPENSERIDVEKLDGSKKGGGQGPGKGGQWAVPQQQPSAQNALSTMAIYVSIIAVFAGLTIVLKKALFLLRRPKALQQDQV